MCCVCAGGDADSIRRVDSSSKRVTSARTNFLAPTTAAATSVIRRGDVVEGFVGVTLESGHANVAIKDVVAAVGIIGVTTQQGLQLAAAIAKSTAEKVGGGAAAITSMLCTRCLPDNNCGAPCAWLFTTIASCPQVSTVCVLPWCGDQKAVCA